LYTAVPPASAPAADISRTALPDSGARLAERKQTRRDQILQQQIQIQQEQRTLADELQALTDPNLSPPSPAATTLVKSVPISFTKSLAEHAYSVGVSAENAKAFSLGDAGNYDLARGPIFSGSGGGAAGDALSNAYTSLGAPPPRSESNFDKSARLGLMKRESAEKERQTAAYQAAIPAASLSLQSQDLVAPSTVSYTPPIPSWVFPPNTQAVWRDRVLLQEAWGFGGYDTPDVRNGRCIEFRWTSKTSSDDRIYFDLQLAYDIIHNAASQSGIEPIPPISKISAPFLPTAGPNTKQISPFQLPHKLRFYFNTDIEKQAVWKTYLAKWQPCSDFTVNIIQDGPARQYIIVNGEFVTTTLSDEAFVFVDPLHELNKFETREGSRLRRDGVHPPPPPRLEDTSRTAGSRTYDRSPGPNDRAAGAKFQRRDEYDYRGTRD